MMAEGQDGGVRGRLNREGVVCVSVCVCVCVCARVCVCVCESLSSVQLLTTPQTVARQAPLSMGFFRQEDWSGLPFPSPEEVPNPRIAPWSLHCRQVLYRLSYNYS